MEEGERTAGAESWDMRGLDTEYWTPPPVLLREGRG